MDESMMIDHILDLYRRGMLTPEEAEARLYGLVSFPPECTPPLPSHMIVPERQVTHTYNGCDTCVIGFRCINDDGLSRDPDPAGKTFTLANDLGLKAVITMHNADLGEGYIEGYTARIRKDPGIRILYADDGHITGLGITAYWDDDLPAYRSFPLWQDYFSWLKETARRRSEYIRKIYLS